LFYTQSTGNQYLLFTGKTSNQY